MTGRENSMTGNEHIFRGAIVDGDAALDETSAATAFPTSFFSQRDSYFGSLGRAGTTYADESPADRYLDADSVGAMRRLTGPTAQNQAAIGRDLAAVLDHFGARMAATDAETALTEIALHLASFGAAATDGGAIA